MIDTKILFYVKFAKSDQILPQMNFSLANFAKFDTVRFVIKTMYFHLINQKLTGNQIF